MKLRVGGQAEKRSMSARVKVQSTRGAIGWIRSVGLGPSDISKLGSHGRIAANYKSKIPHGPQKRAQLDIDTKEM